MAQGKKTLYDSLINLMISTNNNALVTELTTTADVSENFSSNNIRSVIISPDVIAVIYHIKGTMEKNYKIKFLGPEVTKSLVTAEEDKLNPVLYALGKPFVCGNLEEIIIFTQSDKEAFRNVVSLTDRDIDIRNVKSKTTRGVPVRQIYESYTSVDLTFLTKKDIVLKFNKLLHNKWMNLINTKYSATKKMCQQFYQEVLTVALKDSLDKSNATGVDAVRTDVLNRFIKSVHKQTISGAVESFAEDVITDMQRELSDKNGFEDAIKQKVVQQKHTNDKVNQEVEPYIKGFNRLVGVYVYDTAFPLKECNTIIARVSANPKLLLHKELEKSNISTNLMYEYKANDYYKYRVKEQSSLYGDIDIQIANYLDDVGKKFTEVKHTVETRVVEKPKESTKDYLEKAKEINNYLCLYDILSRIIKEMGINSLEDELARKTLVAVNVLSNTKIKPIKGDSFKYLKRFESEEVKEDNEKALDFLKVYIHRNLLKFVLENLYSLNVSHPVLVESIGKNSGSIRMIQDDSELQTLYDKLDKIQFDGKNLNDSVCNLAVLICRFFIRHDDKEKKVINYNITTYSDKAVWQAILNK